MTEGKTDPVARAIALGRATDWVCRYARELGERESTGSPAYDVIAGFAAVHGGEQLKRFGDLVADAQERAPDMVAEGVEVLAALKQLL
ncbi:MAG: hypothetical protein ACE5LB_17520 [Acidiferrobacterales bacterium]